MKKYLALLIFALAYGAFPAYAVPISYSGVDTGTGAGAPRPNSDAAASDFDSAAGALGTVNLIDFESQATGYSPNLTLDSNTTASFSGQISSESSGVSAGNDDNLGFNTTVGGSNHLRFAPVFDWDDARLTLSFANPVQAFGGYFTGLESAINGTVDVMFDNGTMQRFSLADPAAPGVQFFGITDAGASIASVVFNEINTGDPGFRDIWGLDDFRYVNSVPEASTLILLALGLIGAGFGGTRRR